jgi:hypothetical protein
VAGLRSEHSVLKALSIAVLAAWAIVLIYGVLVWRRAYDAGLQSDFDNQRLPVAVAVEDLVKRGTIAVTVPDGGWHVLDQREVAEVEEWLRREDQVEGHTALLDRWHGRCRVAVRKGEEFVDVALLSAGPDGTFCTADDVAAPQYRKGAFCGGA